MREGIPPHLDHKGSIPVHYASKSVGGKRSGSKSRTPHEDSDRAIVRDSTEYHSHLYDIIADTDISKSSCV